MHPRKKLERVHEGRIVTVHIVILYIPFSLMKRHLGGKGGDLSGKHGNVHDVL